jgi:hypothetical protein
MAGTGKFNLTVLSTHDPDNHNSSINFNIPQTTIDFNEKPE